MGWRFSCAVFAYPAVDKVRAQAMLARNLAGIGTRLLTKLDDARFELRGEFASRRTARLGQMGLSGCCVGIHARHYRAWQ